MLAEGKDIITLIPQRSPIVMIDQLLLANEEKTISAFTIPADCIFCENNLFSESGLVENIAQTAAAGVGYDCKTNNKPVPIGFIANIKDLKIFTTPKVGSKITTEVSVKNKVMDVTIVEGKVSQEGELLVQCEMRIFIKPE